MSPSTKEGAHTSGDDVQIKVLINGSEEDSLHSISLTLVNAGNVELENIAAEINFGKDAKIQYFRVLESLGAWEKHVTVAQEGEQIEINFAHINPGEGLTLSVLASDYTLGDVAVDLAAPGVRLNKTTALNLSALSSQFNKGFAFRMFGVGFDPNAIQTATLAEEVRELRKLIAKELQRSRMSD